MRNKNKIQAFWLLFIPVIALFYIGLFLTMFIWYPQGLGRHEWQSHLINFSIVYVLWLVAFFVNQLFDLDSLRSMPRLLIRLAATTVVLVIIAVIYFYFQPALLITPRRFLLVHVFISMLGVTFWYTVMNLVLPHTWRQLVFAHQSMEDEELGALVRHHEFLGLDYGGEVTEQTPLIRDALVVFRFRPNFNQGYLQSLYSLRHHGVRFIGYYEFYETLTRRIHLETLTELWFLNSIDYGSHRLSDAIKRIMDIVIGFIGSLIFVVLFIPLAILIKATSAGPIFFVQPRVGKNGRAFPVYKFRTMSGGATNTWTQKGDARITTVGKWLRKLRMDELPQFYNILKGDMSMVGPRPEQIHIVEQLKEQIPYYDERHMVKPGLTGWAQLHVYAGTVEETRKKLQFDLYYIKNRSFMFDIEIILRTIYKIITFGGE